MCSVEEALELASSLDPQLAFVGARGWGREEQVCEVCAEGVVEGGGGEGGEGVKVKVWAVKAMSEAVVKCSDSQLAQSCQRWRASLASALQSCCSAEALGEVCSAMKALVSRAHCSPTVVKDFSTVSLPPLLSSLLGFQDATPALQAVVLPCLSTIHLLYPSACKPHRPALLNWAKRGLLQADLSLSRESARLLAVMHCSPDHWTAIFTSSLSALTPSLLHLSHTLMQAPPPPNTLNLDLPSSEPARSAHLLRLISSHCRLLSYLLLLLTPPISPLTLPLSTTVGVVSFGLSISGEGVNTTAMDCTLLLTILPIVHLSLLTLLRSLITSSHSHLLPYTSTIDTALLCQLGHNGGVVWRECVNGALCAWVRVRGEGGMEDKFSPAVIQWLLRSCQCGEDGVAEQAMQTLCVVVSCSRLATPPYLAQLVRQAAVDVLSRSSPVSLTLAGVRLLRECLEYYPDSTPLATAIRIFQRYSHHYSNEVCDESRRGLSTCTLLLHPVGPPWNTGNGDTERLNFVTRSTLDINPHLPATLSAGPGWAEFQPSSLTEASVQPHVMGDSSRSNGPPRASSGVQTEVWGKKRRREEVEHSVREDREIEGSGEGREMEESGEEREMGESGEERKMRESGEGREMGESGEGREMEESGEKRESGEGREMGESEGRDVEVCGEWREVEDSGDSDVDDIIATFCSSPSTDND